MLNRRLCYYNSLCRLHYFFKGPEHAIIVTGLIVTSNTLEEIKSYDCRGNQTQVSTTKLYHGLSSEESDTENVTAHDIIKLLNVLGGNNMLCLLDRWMESKLQ